MFSNYVSIYYFSSYCQYPAEVSAFQFYWECLIIINSVCAGHICLHYALKPTNLLEYTCAFVLFES